MASPTLPRVEHPARFETEAPAIFPGELADQGSDWCGQHATSPLELTDVTAPLPPRESNAVRVPGSAGSAQREGCGGG